MRLSSGIACPNCGEYYVSIFYEAKDIPVSSCLMMTTSEKALAFPRSDVTLGFCGNCGFIFNTSFNQSKIDYSAVYEDQQCFSSTFNSYAQNLARSLIEKYDLHNRHILEIGCGKGDFLALLCEMGNNYGLGVDPAFVPSRIQSAASDRLTFVQEHFSERHADHNVDFVCCRHTLEHIYNTAEFVQTLRRSIGERMSTVVFFEVPDVTRILREIAFWDIYYEHCSYFNLGSLARLFRSCKFEVISLSKVFNDQYLLIEAKPVDHMSKRTYELEETVTMTAEDVGRFTTESKDKLSKWRQQILNYHNDGRRVVIWGSGSKCVSFLTTLGIKDEIDYIIDINPYRHGKYIPGVGKKIVSPNFAKKHKPDVTVVMNPVYTKEITQMLNDMGVNSEIVSV